MARKFDTASKDVTSQVPPKGSCRVCVEGRSDIKPNDPSHMSYTLIGDWSDVLSANNHARSAQETYNAAAKRAGQDAPVIVAFSWSGDVLYRGVPFVAQKAPASVATEAA